MIAADPHQGGATWAVLQYLLGLRRLGHEVCFVEPIKAGTIRPLGAALAESDNATYFRQVVEQFDLRANAALLLEGTHTTVGLAYAGVLARARQADVSINVSGMLTDQDIFGRPP